MMLSDRLLKFIKTSRGKYKFKMNPDLLLQKDLKIYGDDAYEFMNDFFGEFGINPKGFVLSDYFEDEGGTNYFVLGSSRKKQLSLGDLQQFIDEGNVGCLTS